MVRYSYCCLVLVLFFFFKQKTAYEMRISDWSSDVCSSDLRRLDQIEPGALTDALRGIIGWEAMQAIDRLAPVRFNAPAGSSHAIDYGAEGGPRVELRVQALFGIAGQPTEIGRASCRERVGKYV